MMSKKTRSCTLCGTSNLSSICAGCVNYRLNEYSVSLKSLKGRREYLYLKLSNLLVLKQKADTQLSLKMSQNEKLGRLKEKLRLCKGKLLRGKTELSKMTCKLKNTYTFLESAMSLLEKARVEQLEKFYPNLICTQSLGHIAITSERLHKQSLIMKQICKLFPQRHINLGADEKDASKSEYDQICSARLPHGLDPYSVPPDELAASLGYMVQLLSIVVQNIAAPALNNAGFAGSCSRIWQRSSFWDARPSSRSNEYPLFIPHQNYRCNSGENSWSERSSSNFGLASIESERKHRLLSSGSGNFNYSPVSLHVGTTTNKDLQRGISLLKRSVACVTAYGFNSLCLEVPSDVSTFEAFGKLLCILSSPKEVRSVFALKTVCSRSCKQVQELNKSAWNVSSAISSSILADSVHTLPIMRGHLVTNLPSIARSYLHAMEAGVAGRHESVIEGWDLVEHPTLPPPPSQLEDIEHWTRAMFIDATKK